MWSTWWSVTDLGGRRENEHNNTLKTKGCNLEHNFGHGSEHLSKLPFCSTRCSSSLTNATLCCENLYAADRPSSKTSDHSPVTGALMDGTIYCCSCCGVSNCQIPGDSPPLLTLPLFHYILPLLSPNEEHYGRYLTGWPLSAFGDLIHKESNPWGCTCLAGADHSSINLLIP